MVIELSVSVSTFGVWFTWTLAVRSRSSSFWAMLQTWNSSCFVVASLKRKQNKNNVQMIQFRCLNITSFQALSFSSLFDFSAVLRDFLQTATPSSVESISYAWIPEFIWLLWESHTLCSRCKIELVTSLRCCDGYQMCKISKSVQYPIIYICKHDSSRDIHKI